MKRILFVLILISIIKLSYSQEYKTSYGNTFRIGDSITIGNRFYSNGFKNVFNAIEYTSSVIAQPTKKYVITEIDVNNAEFKKRIHDKNAVRIKIATKKGPLGLISYINIEPAIKDGEVVLKLNPKRIFNVPATIDQKLTFLIYCKVSGFPVKKFREEYLYRFQNDIYIKTHQDEFEFQNSLAKAEKTLETELLRIDTAKIYYSGSQLELGNYDFEKQAFTYDFKNKAILAFNYLETSIGNFPALGISFKDSLNNTHLPISSLEANSFIKRRKDYKGDINRVAYVIISFKVLKNPILETRDFPKKETYWLRTKVKSIEFYDTQTFLYNWLGTVNY